ncbi:MAG: hemolysin III family protein [Desulfuromonas sp.]|nr:hemolysin III family protein [Desulfuromonas sp.]
MSARVGTARYSTTEELANSITHGVGIVLAICGLGILITVAAESGGVWHMVSCSVFGTTLILLYASSTLYHSIPLPRAKAVLRVFDHVAILLLIAGTYTPFTLITLHGPWGWSLFGVIWFLAVAGIFIELSTLRRRRALSIALYVAMGWVIVLAVKPLLAALPSEGWLLLLLGGLAYTGGIGFYLWRRLPYHHAIWHLFVLTGSVLHFFAVLLYVMPVTVLT